MGIMNAKSQTKQRQSQIKFFRALLKGNYGFLFTYNIPK